MASAEQLPQRVVITAYFSDYYTQRRGGSFDVICNSADPIGLAVKSLTVAIIKLLLS